MEEAAATSAPVAEVTAAAVGVLVSAVLSTVAAAVAEAATVAATVVAEVEEAEAAGGKFLRPHDDFPTAPSPGTLTPLHHVLDPASSPRRSIYATFLCRPMQRLRLKP